MAGAHEARPYERLVGAGLVHARWAESAPGFATEKLAIRGGIRFVGSSATIANYGEPQRPLMHRPSLIVAAIVALLPGSLSAQADPKPAPTKGYAAVPPARHDETSYVFGWGERPVSIANPRGGSSEGAPVTLAPGRTLPLPEIASAKDAFNRDRAAILALAGDFRVSFHEIESLGLAANYEPPRSYHSWATERVQVIEDTGRRISLQHTLVMFFRRESGEISGPALTKHWRQDWTFEDDDILVWEGGDVWARRRLDTAAAAGTWSHAVFNLEDSPRYEASGRWEHRGNVSMWNSERAWRPLPRREHSVRSDYDVVEGVHNVVITPTGWVEERNMWKRATEGGKSTEPPRYVAQELGIDRYERITSPSLDAAHTYWSKAAPYWAIVRQVWREEMARRDRFMIRDEFEGKISYQFHNEYVKKLEGGGTFAPDEAGRFVRRVVAGFLATDGK